MSTDNAELSLAPSTLTRVLGFLAVLLLVASVTGQIAKLGFGHDYMKGLVPLFDVDEEENVPTYFTVLLLLTASFLLGITAVLEGRGTRPRWPWAFLSLGFLLMGYDEAFQVHERFIEPMRRFLGGGRLGVFRFAWVAPGLLLVFFLTLAFFRFLVRLPAPTRRRFVLAAALYLGGCIGMEMVGGWLVERYGFNNWQYAIATTVEEGMEMAGLIAFVWALLLRWADNGTAILVRFTKR